MERENKNNIQSYQKMCKKIDKHLKKEVMLEIYGISAEAAIARVESEKNERC